jgi:hypothetical protein
MHNNWYGAWYCVHGLQLERDEAGVVRGLGVLQRMGQAAARIGCNLNHFAVIKIPASSAVFNWSSSKSHKILYLRSLQTQHWVFNHIYHIVGLRGLQTYH